MTRPNLIFTYWGPCDFGSEEPQLSVHWYRHSRNFRYRGFTIRFRALTISLDLTFVNDYAEYRKKFPREETTSWKLFPWRTR